MMRCMPIAGQNNGPEYRDGLQMMNFVRREGKAHEKDIGILW